MGLRGIKPLSLCVGALCALLVVWVDRATAGPLAASLGPEAPLAEPIGGYLGRLEVSPTHGPSGTSVTVTAEKLPPNQEFQLVWRTVRGHWNVGNAEYHGREYKPVAYEIARLRSDEAGRLSANFFAPDDFGFSHDVVLQQGSRLLTQAGFSIDMTVKLAPESGPVGTPIRVEVKGIGWRQLFNSWMLLYDNNFTGWISSVTTNGSATFTIPAAGQPGVHILEILHGEFTFPYRNMQQNPEPDRPRWAMPFTITPGRPVLPPAPNLQAQEVVRRLPIQGELVASPQFSGVNETVLVQAEGFEPGKRLQLNWSRVIGNRMTGRGWEESSHIISESKADVFGRAEFHFNVPDDLGGLHGLWIESDTIRKTGNFWIKATA